MYSSNSNGNNTGKNSSNNNNISVINNMNISSTRTPMNFINGPLILGSKE